MSLIPHPAIVREELTRKEAEIKALRAQLKLSIRHHGDDQPAPISGEVAGDATDSLLPLDEARDLPDPESGSKPETESEPPVTRSRKASKEAP